MLNRKTLSTALKVLALPIVLALLYVVLSGIGFRNILAAMARADVLSVASASLLFLAFFVLRCFCWQQLMRPEDRKSVVVLLPLHMAATLGNMITPGARVGGEAVRAYYMSRAFGGEKSAHLGVILAEKLGNGAVFMAVLLASVVLVLLLLPLGLTTKVVLEALVVLVVATLISGFLLRKHIPVDSRLLERLLVAIYNGRLLKLLRRRFPTYGQFEDYAIRKLENVFGPIGRAATNPKYLAKVISISGAAWLLFYLAHLVLFKALGARISLMEVVIVVTISQFIGDASILPGGAGFMETAMIALCAAIGVEPATAAAVTLISRGIFYVYGFGVGGLCLGVLALIFGRRKPEPPPESPPEEPSPGQPQ